MAPVLKSIRTPTLRRSTVAMLVVGIVICATLVVLRLLDAEDARATNPYFRFLGIVERPMEKPTSQVRQPSDGRSQWQSSKYLARMSYVNTSDKPVSFTGRRRGSSLEVTVLHQYFEHRSTTWHIPSTWRGRPKFLAVGTIVLEERDESVLIAPQDGIILLVPLDRLLMELCNGTDVEVRMLLDFPPYPADRVSARFRLPNDFKSDIHSCGK